MITRVYKTKIQAGIPTPNHGKIFSREKLEGAIREYLASDVHMGMLEDFDDDGFELDYDRISHNVKHIFLDDEDCMCVEIAFLDTEQGRIAQMAPDLLEAKCAMVGFCGWEGDSNIVIEAGIVNLNLGWKVEEVELAA